MLVRRWGLVTVGIAALLASACVLGQAKPERSFRIGYLVPGSAETFAGRLAAFKQQFAKLGYVEGKNLVVEYRAADGNFERLPALADELVRLKVDLIVAQTTPATQAAKQATQTIPIVMGSVGNPVETGLVASLAKPGGNITGVTNFTGDTSAKQLDLLAATVPKLTAVCVLWNPMNASTKAMLGDVRAAARAINVQLHFFEAHTAEGIDKAFAQLAKERPQALLLLADAFFLQQRVQITRLAAQVKVPAIYNVREYTEVGGLMSYGANALDISRLSAIYADRILKGAPPASLPVERPNTVEFVLNAKTAEALRLRISGEVRMRADEVIR